MTRKLAGVFVNATYTYSATRLYETVRGRPYIQKKTHMRDSSIPIPIHTQESEPGDRALYADIPCI